MARAKRFVSNKKLAMIAGCISLVGYEISRADVSFAALNPLPGANRSFSGVLSADGSTLVGWAFTHDPNDPTSSGPPGRIAQWTRSPTAGWSSPSTVELFTPPGSEWAGPSAISATGSQIAFYGGTASFYWNSGSAVPLPLPPASAYRSQASISADGTTIHAIDYSTIDGHARLLSWQRASNGTITLSTNNFVAPDNGGPVFISPERVQLNANGSRAWGNAGISSPWVDPFVWSAAGGFELLPIRSTIHNAVARALSADGLVAVGNDGGETSPAVIWKKTAAGWTIDDLPTLPGVTLALPFGITTDGVFITGHASLDDSGPGFAFISSEATGMIDVNQYLTGLGVNLAGWQLTSVTLADDGRTLYGNGLFNGLNTAWIAQVPTPSATLAAVFGCFACLHRRRR